MIPALVLAVSLGSAETAPALTPTATYWEYGSLCDATLPPVETLTMKAVSKVNVRYGDCALHAKKWGTPAAVRVHFENAGDAEVSIALPPLQSVTLRGTGAPRPALGMLMRQPDAAGKGGVAPVPEIDGELAFSVEPGKVLDLVFLFASARRGDRLTFGVAEPVVVDGTVPAVVAPRPVRLVTKASLWKGTACDEPPSPPRGFTMKKGSLKTESCSAKGRVVRIEVRNAGGGEALLSVPTVVSLRLRQAAGTAVAAKGFGLTLPGLMSKQTQLVSSLEGGVEFPIVAGEAMDLLVVFPSAAVGDTVTVGNAPPAVIR